MSTPEAAANGMHLWWGYENNPMFQYMAGVSPWCFHGYGYPPEVAGMPPGSVWQKRGKGSKEKRERAKTWAGPQFAWPIAEHGHWAVGEAGHEPLIAHTTAGEVPIVERPTTIMLRNIPTGYSQLCLLSLLEEKGFSPRFDFAYLPMDFRNHVSLGYAFVNLFTHDDALECMETFNGFTEWKVESAKVCWVTWAHPHQGLHEHIDRYRNSPVMHPNVPDEYKPMIFQNGVRVPFPPPTKSIRAPRMGQQQLQSSDKTEPEE